MPEVSATRRSRGSDQVAHRACALLLGAAVTAVHADPTYVGPTNSQPLSLDAAGEFLGVVNPDNNSVTVFDLRNDRNRRIATVPVQIEPRSVAFTPPGKGLYVANAVSGTVTFINTAALRNGYIPRPTLHIPTGTEPSALATTPNGSRLFVVNARSFNVTIINTATNTVVGTVNAPAQPRAVAITNDGDTDDSDEFAVTSNFLALPTANPGTDNGGLSIVFKYATGSNAIVGSGTLVSRFDTGFNANGDALNRIPPGPGFDFPTGAYPNQIASIVIKNGVMYFPNTGASPNGPVRFDVNTQPLINFNSVATGFSLGEPFNLNREIAAQTNSDRLFFTQPSAMACKHQTNECYITSAASNVIMKVEVDPVNGVPTVVMDPNDSTRVLQIPVGKNPRGIVINGLDTRAYVMNYVSRDVTVINLSNDTPMATLPSAALPAPGTLADRIHIGKELFNTSIGTFDPPPGSSAPITGRMSNEGWSSCASCHFDGLTDGTTWIFSSGPRRTIALNAAFDRTDPTRQRLLNWSATRDEAHDFEALVRDVAGGDGAIVETDGTTPASVADFDPPNEGRQQLTVRGVGAWDAIKAYIQYGIRTPIARVPATDPDAIAGRTLFAAGNCQSCHGGAQWTRGLRDFTPPPHPDAIVDGQVIGALRDVGTFNPAAFNEVRDDAGPPLGADGYVPPSLLGIGARDFGLLHNGVGSSLNIVLGNVAHRSAGTGGVDTLSNSGDRAKVVRFLQSIDASTPPFP